jgi:hypothetical protein
MSERTPGQAPKPQLYASQLAIKAMCDEILALKPPGSGLIFYEKSTVAPAHRVQQKLRRRHIMDELLLPNRADLSWKPASEHENLGLYIGKAKPLTTTVRGWVSNLPRLADRTVEAVDEHGDPLTPWDSKLSLKLGYANENHMAFQVLSASTSSFGRKLPILSRVVISPSYAPYDEIGFEGYNQLERPAHSDEEALAFVQLAQEVFIAKPAKPPSH